MKLTRSASTSSGLLGVVPLINVVLLLLLFFLLGSSFVLQPGVSVSLPFSSFQMAPQVDAQVVTLAPGNPPRIFYRNKAVNFEEFARSLSEIPRDRRKSLIVRADVQVPYDSIMRVSTAALEAGFQVILATAPARS